MEQIQYSSSLKEKYQRDKRQHTQVGANLIKYPANVSTKTAEVETAKLLLNSVLSTPGAKFMTIDIKNFYLNTPMNRYKYMTIPYYLIPDEIKKQYELENIVENDHVYVEIRRGTYGLPQAGKIANDQLFKHLAKYGYAPTKHTPGLWTHRTRKITFFLVVDDFGIKYTNEEDVTHLMHALQKMYQITTDKKGKLFCGITLDWDYTNRTVDLSISGYILAALTRFKHL
eukprot:15364848-Ditylum_brightwellii.AAC.1